MTDSTSQRIAAAARVLLDEHGAEGVTMRKVAGVVGTTAMALYRHYPNRDGLLNALADMGFAELAAKLASLRLTGRTERQLQKVLDAFVDYAFENPRLFELMFLTKREGARQYPEDFRMRRSPTATISADIIARGMEAGEFRKDDVWEIVFESGAMLQGLIMLYLGGRMAMSPAEFRALFRRSFERYLNGLRA
jgi:AcrR family transcriptional regulator